MVTLKGRVAATIQSADELVLTELIFNSGFKACSSTRTCHFCPARDGKLSCGRRLLSVKCHYTAV